jgi:hypothetical protein
LGWTKRTGCNRCSNAVPRKLKYRGTPIIGIVGVAVQAHDNCRVIWKDDGLEIETGSIGVSGTYVRFTDTGAALFA